VWSAGQPRSGERHWFDVEDLDADGVGEVVAFFRGELDVFYAEEAVDETSGGASGDASTDVDAVAVFRLSDGKWKKDDALLEGLR
jgi:hypothetical protein